MEEYMRYLNRFWGETDIFIRYAGNAPFDEGNTTILDQVSEVEKYTLRLVFESTPGWYSVFINNDTVKKVRIVGIRKGRLRVLLKNVQRHPFSKPYGLECCDRQRNRGRIRC
jgi:hypothetical protein